MKIAIVGAGFCGLALAWSLSKHDSHKITLFDPVEIGKGTSGIAAGLLHPFAGAHSKLNWKGLEAFDETLHLLKEVELFANKKLHKQTGLLRLALSEQQKADFKIAANKYPVLVWKEPNELHVPMATVVDCPSYLESLWKGAESRGVIRICQKITSLQELMNFDRIFCATGAMTASIEELSHLPITQIKGQLFSLNLPKNDLPKNAYSSPINSQAYLLESLNNEWILGATYEKNFETSLALKEKAFELLYEKAVAILPGFNKEQILECRAGVRASAPGHLPMLKKLDDRTVVITGMGSKGLLYHAYMAALALKEFY